MGDMEDDALVEATATAAAGGIESLDIAPWAGLLLIPAPPLYALVWGIPADPRLEDFELDPDTELDYLPDPDSAAWEEVKTRIEDDDILSSTPFYLTLASKIRALTGLTTLIHDVAIDVSYDEQLARQEGATSNAADLLRGLDVLVWLQVDEVRVAVVYRDAQGQVWSSGRYGYEDPEPGLGRWADLGSNPAVLAGRVPLGAASVNLRISARGPWIEPDALNRGVWICALDTRELRRTPQLRYHDAEGVEFAVEVPFDSPEPPQLWPVQAPTRGRLVAYGGAGSTVEGGDWRVEISTVGPGAGAVETPGELLAWRGVRVDPARLSSRAIVGSVLGHRHGFELAAPSGIWVAIADCGGVQLVVQGVGEPPARLDLELLEPSEHRD